MMVMIGHRIYSPRLAWAGMMISLVSSFNGGDRLQQPQRADTIGTQAHMHPANQLALPEREISNAGQYGQDHRNDLDQHPRNGPGLAK